MDAADHIEISPKIRIFTPKMHIFVKFGLSSIASHNLLGLFAKCGINLEKQKTLPGEILQCCRGFSCIFSATYQKVDTTIWF
jgi:hypothetical protein